jgi:hypothetical protein
MFRYISPAVALYTETASVYPEPPLWHPVALFAERERERERERADFTESVADVT